MTIDQRETLYRVALEAIQNSMKHAKASRITLHIAQPTENEVSMEIIDNSCGFDPQQSYSGHYGLVYMRERIRARLPVRPASSQIAPIATSSHAAIS